MLEEPTVNRGTPTLHERLSRHLLVDGYPMVLDLEASHGCTFVDKISGREYLDCFSFFASNPIGFRHPRLIAPEMQRRLAHVATTRVANSDIYTDAFADFVATLERTAAPAALPYYFFVDGGALAVENAMKTAFDWKCQKNRASGSPIRGDAILHFERAFHGRSGYTLSVTNTDPAKTRDFPQFDWPRCPAPALSFPTTEVSARNSEFETRRCLGLVRRALQTHAPRVAAILIEPIQGEGGDNHFPRSFFQGLRALADEFDALLIFDEVQTGLGTTGRWWAYEHFGITPDIISFAKKMQVGGIFASRRLDEVSHHVFRQSSRINSTWGGSLVDMVRCTEILKIIQEESLVENAAIQGAQLVAGLEELATQHPDTVHNARGRGLFCAIDARSPQARDQILQSCFEQALLLLPCGATSIRFRPSLNITKTEIETVLNRLQSAVRRCQSNAA